MSSSNESTDSAGSSRRSGSAPKSGSVWETRMKIDQFKGGIKVFENSADTNSEIEKQSPNGMSGKRKTWKSENSDGSPVKLAALRSDLSRNFDEHRKSPVSIKKSSLRRAITGSMDEKIKKCDGDEKKVVDDDKKLRSDEDCQEINGGDGLVLDEDREVEAEKKSGDDDKQKRIVFEEKKLVQSNQNTVPISSIPRKQHPPPLNNARFQQIPSKIIEDSECSSLSLSLISLCFPFQDSDDFQRIPGTNNRLQSLVDLVMWRDVSKSAFVFGIGSFAIISSSFTEGLNISYISVLSYLGLVYLAAIFLFRSLISRGSLEKDGVNHDCVIGEEEAIWVIKLLLPFMNEFLLKLRALFSGDPSTTMKLAVLLFILARCGSCITIWTTAKLGFIGVFTVPKVCSAYSSQITTYGTFWIRRFRDAWASCSHKKAIGIAVFALVWNLSSVVTRIWEVFVLFVAFKHYQQSLIKEEWALDESINGRDSPRTKEHNSEKLKKAF